jgi:tRNA(Ile)-lysidine synthase
VYLKIWKAEYNQTLPAVNTKMLQNLNITDKNIAIACSGGADSLALAHLLAAKYAVTALIVNHNLRPAAKTEAAATAKILKQLGIKHAILTYKGRAPTKNVQEEARKIRYKLLADYCKKHGIKTIATAHHADDNAENFLLRLARGSGVDGLAAMPYATQINGLRVIRPLLNHTKQELVAYLKAHKIKWVEDATNKTSKYKRNSLRHALEKVEDKELITRRINLASQNLARVRSFLEQETAKALKTCLKNNQLDIKKLAKLHDEITFRVLAASIAKFSPKPKSPRFEELKTLLAALQNGQKKTLAGLIFTPKQNNILITIEK